MCPPGVEGYGSAEDFFSAMLALPVVIVFWVIGYFWKGKGWLRTVDMDVDTGRREHDWKRSQSIRHGLLTCHYGGG